MKLLFALISVMVSISRRTFGISTKLFDEISTDVNCLQWTSSLGRLESLLLETLRELRLAKHVPPNCGVILLMRLLERLLENLCSSQNEVDSFWNLYE